MNNALTISELTKTYKDFVLDKVSFSVPEGSIVGLIGENGAGRTQGIFLLWGKKNWTMIPKNRLALFLTAAITRKSYLPKGSTE